MKALFVCIHNSARSQMAEAFANRLGGDAVQAQSAGLESGVLNPLVVQAMAEIGYDLSNNSTKSVFDAAFTRVPYDPVITVCDESSGDQCPIFPTTGQRENWSFADPSTFVGDDSAKLVRIRTLRDEIKTRVASWLAQRGVAVKT